MGARRQQQHRHFASPGKEGVRQWPMRKWSRRRQAGRPSRGGGGGGGTPAVGREGQATADLRDELVGCIIINSSGPFLQEIPKLNSSRAFY